MRHEAEAEFKKVQAADVADRRSAWRDWVLGAVKSRPGLLYKWVRGKAQPPKAATTVDGTWTLDPRGVVEGEAAGWGALWVPEGVAAWVERPPRAPTLALLDGTMIWDTARRMRQRAAAGACGWRPRNRPPPPLLNPPLRSSWRLCFFA